MKPKTPVLEADLNTLDTLDVDALVLLLPEDVRPLRGMAGYLDWRLCGRLSSLMRSDSVKGARGEKVLTPAHDGVKAKRVFVFGWGKSSELCADAPERFSEVVQTLKEAKVETCAIDLCFPGRPLLSMVDEHLKKPLGDALVGVFAPEETGPSTSS